MYLEFLDFVSHAAVYLVFVLIGILTHKSSSHDHTWHYKLADILVALSQRPSPPGEDARMIGESLNNVLWADLPLYKPEFKHSWEDAAIKAYAEYAHDFRIDESFVPNNEMLSE